MLLGLPEQLQILIFHPNSARVFIFWSLVGLYELGYLALMRNDEVVRGLLPRMRLSQK